MLGFGARESTTTTGTGNLTTSAVSGYPRLTDVFNATAQRRFFYSILDANNLPLEHGVGYCSAVGTFVREKVLATYSGGVYTDAGATALSLPAGTYYVIITDGPAQFAGTPGLASANTAGAFILGYTGSQVNWTPNAANTIQLFSAYLGHAIVCKGLLARLAVASSGGNARFGLYDLNASGLLQHVLIDTGAISTTTTGVITYSLGTSVYLRPGPYVLVYNCDSTAGTTASWTGSTFFAPYSVFGASSAGGASTPLFGVYVSATFGAFSDSPGGVWVDLRYPGNLQTAPFVLLTV